MRRFAILVAMFVVTVVATTTSALAGGGNSGAAAACQQDGWQSLYRSDGTGFTNTGDCVSYAARGGTLQTQCQPGSWSPTGVTPCTPAGVGYYVDTAGATAQTPCPVGTTTAGTGPTTAADCVSAGPTITSATWTSCASFTINGSGFTGATKVTTNTLGDVAFTVVSDSEIDATTPFFGFSGMSVSVTTPAGTASGTVEGNESNCVVV